VENPTSSPDIFLFTFPLSPAQTLLVTKAALAQARSPVPQDPPSDHHTSLFFTALCALMIAAGEGPP